MSVWRDGFNYAYEWFMDRFRATGGFLAPLTAPRGEPWPPPEALERLAGYLRGKRLYESEHEEVYVGGPNGYQYRKQRPYLVNNVLGELTDIIVDRLFGEPLSIRGPEGTEDWLQWLSDANGLDTLWTELATGTSYRGDGLLKVRYDADERAVVIDTVSPQIYFPTVESDDGDAVTDAQLAWVISIGGKPHLRIEHHFPGRIENSLYELKPDTHSGGWRYDPERDLRDLSLLDPEPPEAQETGVDEMLLVHIAMRATDEPGVWGSSDYQDVDSLQGELNNRYTQRAEILDEHANPWMYGSGAWLTERGQLAWNERYLIVNPDEQPPGYVAWNPHLVSVEHEIEELRHDIAFLAGISPESLSRDEGGPESGRALKLKQWRTASAVRRRQRLYDGALRQAISIATALARVHGVDFEGAVPDELEPGDLTLQWSDGLPVDRMEDIQEESVLYTSGLTSRKAALQRLNPGMSDEQVDEELAEIAREARGNGNDDLGLRVGLGAVPEDDEEEAAD